MEYLRKNGIYCNISYQYPIHSMRGYKHFNDKKNDLKITEKLSQQIFSLPMYPELDTKKIEKVIDVINKY